ncbi:MAG: DUF4197 family protein [Verrucomicrobia bacterium]|nr:DUF4197 family protein [Verrucomicrobiota bacterium]
MKSHSSIQLAAGLGVALWGAQAQGAAPALDTHAAFMQYVTNYTYRTNAVVVTNYVVVTNAVVTTNFYNAQGQLLLPVPPSTPAPSSLIPIVPPKPPRPDPAQAKATQLQAIRDLLVQALKAASNKVSIAGSFTTNTAQQIQIPQGVTSFDRRKSQALLTAMNLTAEQAAPEVVGMLLKRAAAIKTDQPATVIKGERDAALRLFMAACGQELPPQLLGAVQRAGVEPRLRETYSSVMLKGGGLLGSVLSTGPAVDIESHVAQGLFRAITNHLAAQEHLVRTNAAFRKTPALQEAFKPQAPRP